MGQVKAVPEGLHSITPQLSVDGCDAAMEFWKKAFGAELKSRAPDPSGKKVWHAEMRVGNSSFFCNDAFPDMGGPPQPASLWIYLDNVDAAFKRATDAGAKVMMPLGDMFWGDRMGTVVDAWNIRWTIAQRMKNLTEAEMKQAADAFIASMPKK